MAARTRPSRVASAPENAEKRSAGTNGPEINPGDTSAVQAGLPEEREIRRQQMAALVRQTPVISTVSMANSLVTALVFWGVASHLNLVVWLCIVWAMALVHLSRWQRYRQRPASSHVSRRGPRRATIWAFLSGCVWASSLSFFWAAPITYQMVLMIVIAGMAAGAATTLASIPSAAAAFVLTSITPFIVYFAIQWDVAYLALALMALVLTMAMLVSAYIVHQQFIESVRTRFENQAQLAQFHAERDDWLEISDTSEAFALFDQDDRLLMWNENYRRILSLPDGELYRGARRVDILRQCAPPIDVANGERTLGEWIEAQLHLHAATPATVVEQLSNGRSLKSSARKTGRGHTATTHIDITELKDHEGALIRAQEEAVQANAAKSEFLANMSHELRTPLNAIIGFSEVMMNQLLGKIGTPRYLEYSKNIHDSGRHLLDLISDILDLSRVEAGKMELWRRPVNMLQTIEASFQLVLPAAKEGGVDLVIKPDCCDQWPLLFADETKIKQILLNILSNAIKFTPRGGSVTVQSSRTEEGAFVISATDTGIGIAADALPLVLEPFRRLEPAHRRRYPGTGLGLPLAKALVELHGGTLSIESTPDEGTTVTISLPALLALRRKASEEAEAEAARQAPAE